MVLRVLKHTIMSLLFNFFLEVANVYLEFGSIWMNLHSQLQKSPVSFQTWTFAFSAAFLALCPSSR